ncbi:hypothetical protein MUK42_32528, partial [Musa troglodytarum]
MSRAIFRPPFDLLGSARDLVVRVRLQIRCGSLKRESTLVCTYAGGHECILACFLSLSIINMAPSCLVLFLWLARRKLCCKDGVRISVERLSCHASYASSHGPPSRSPSLWPRRTGWRGSGLRSHGQLKLVRRGREGQQLGGRSVPVLVAAHAVEESIASYVGHMLHVRREPNLHLHLVVIVP